MKWSLSEYGSGLGVMAILLTTALLYILHEVDMFNVVIILLKSFVICRVKFGDKCTHWSEN